MTVDLAVKTTEVLGEELLLTNQRAVFWERKSLLILSDLHIGKTAHFRRNGIAIPQVILQDDLLRLQFLLDRFQPEHVLINGDLLHAGDNADVDFFCEWKSAQNAKFHLVRGNHDRLNNSLQEKLCLDSHSTKLIIDDLCFIHEFEPEEAAFQITGHIHPGKILRTGVRSFRLPSYVKTERQLLLPAFSKFTGLDTQSMADTKGTAFVFTDREIYEL